MHTVSRGEGAGNCIGEDTCTTPCLTGGAHSMAQCSWIPLSFWLLWEWLCVKGRAGRTAGGSDKVLRKRAHPTEAKRYRLSTWGSSHSSSRPSSKHCLLSQQVPGGSAAGKEPGCPAHPRLGLPRLGGNVAHLKGTVPVPCASLLPALHGNGSLSLGHVPTQSLQLRSCSQVPDKTLKHQANH